MADVRVELKGFAELAEAMRQLSPKLETRGLNGANYAGAKVLVDAAKATGAFHDRTHTLRKSIRAFRRRSHPAHQVTHAVGVSNKIALHYANSPRNRRLGRAGKRYFVQAGPGLYGRFLEFGTSKMAPHPFLRPALFASVYAMTDAIREGLARAIKENMK